MAFNPSSRDASRHIYPNQSEGQDRDFKFVNFKIEIFNTPCSKADTEDEIVLEYSPEDSIQKSSTNDTTQQYSLNEVMINHSQRVTMVTTLTEEVIQKYSSDNAMQDSSSEDTSLDSSSEDTSLDSSSEDTSLDSSSEDISLDCSSDDTMQNDSSSDIMLSYSPYQSDDQDSNSQFSDLDINIQNPEAEAPLLLADDTYVASIYTAACNNALDTIDKSRINEQNSAGETPLMIAVRERNPTAATLLKRHGADLEISKDPDGKFTTLSLAAAKEYVDLVKTLVGLGARVDCIESGTILNIARVNGFLEDIVYLENEFRRSEGLESSALYLAVEKGDVEIVKALVGVGADLDKLDKFGQTVLQRAVNYQHKDIAECLIHAGVYVDSEDVDGQTALTQACLNIFEGQTFVSAFDLDDVENDGSKNIKLIQLLLEKGADPNIKDRRGRSLLFRSLEENHFDLANVLIEGNADVNIANEVGETPLNIVINSNKTDMIRNLLRKGADVNLYGGKFLPNPIHAAETGNVELMKLFLQHKTEVDVTVNGVNALFISIEKNDRMMWELLVSNGAGVDAVNTRGETALMMAVKSGNIDLLRLLVQHGADVDCLNSRRVSALYEAVILGSCEAVQILVEAGAALDSVYFNDGSVLHLALRKQRNDIAALIVRTKINMAIFIGEKMVLTGNMIVHGTNFVDVVNRRMQTALHIAAEMGSVSLVNVLIKAGANVNMTDGNNKTALQIGIGNTDITEVLLKAGADPNVSDEQGETPLLHAVAYDQGFPLVRLLVQSKSNINVKNKHGQTPLMLAVVQGNIVIINLLLEHGAISVHQTNLGLAALDHIISKRSVNSLESMILAGADISASNKNGETFLIHSVKLARIEIVELLLKYGADVNVQDNGGKTALMYNAATHSTVFSRIEELLLQAGANVNLQDKKGKTALMYTAKYEIFHTRSQLHTAEKISINMEDFKHRTALYYAFKNINGALPRLTLTVVDAIKFNAGILLNLKINPCLNIDQQMLENLFSRCGLLDFNDKISDFNRFEHMRLCVSNGYMYKQEKHQTLFSLALSSGKVGVIKYLISNCYLMNSDLRIIRLCSSHPRARIQEIKLAACKPWPLVKLAFIAVSTLLGSGANRTQRVQRLELPEVLQDALMFKTPIARLARKKWSKIPVCFDVEEYEKLENPRPLLSFWPYGCYLRL